MTSGAMPYNFGRWSALLRQITSGASAQSIRSRVASKFMQRRRKRGTSGRGVTFEHDRQRIYRKKRMPKGKRRRWVKFVRKVNAVDERDLGTRTVVNNRSVQVSLTSANTQMVSDFGLYGQSSANSWMNDLAQIVDLENTADPTSAAGINVGDGTKFMFQSGVLDLTARNTTTFNNGTEQVPATDAVLEVDVYDIVSGCQWNNTGVTANSIIDVFNDGSAETKVLNNGANAIEIADRGATPWDVPHALSKYKLKILKKTKYRIGYGNTITYQVRDPKRHVSSKARLNEATGANKPGWTRHVMFIIKLVPGLTQGGLQNEYTTQMDFGITRKYMYKLEGANQPRDRYQPGL